MRKAVVLVLAGALIGCNGDLPSEPVRHVRLAIQAGDGQFGTSAALLPDLLEVVATDPASGAPVEDVEVNWRIVQGVGAAVSSDASSTLNNGIARTALRLGAGVGTYIIEATADNLVGSPVRFEARVVNRPVITAIAPRTVDAGATVTITGQNFSTLAGENVVLFGGFSGRVVSATSNELRVTVPLCLPSRRIGVIAQLGTVASTADSIDVNGSANTALALAPGQVRVFSGDDLACLNLSTQQSGQRLLIVAQNSSDAPNTYTPFQLSSLLQPGAVAAAPFALDVDAQRAVNFGSAWELQLRAQERALPYAELQPQLPAALRVAPPQLGDRRDFQVINRDNKFTRVTAEVKYVSDHAITYQDIKAPANGFSAANFEAIGRRFDSPTFDVVTGVFGQPSDIDNNGRIIILFTPVVNELTPPGASGFVAGFYYGCDLLTKQACSGSNGSEIFYLFLPDPTGAHGDARSPDFVMRGISPVLGHEFQHMIHFGKRRNQDVLWLSEGLAHMAEDLVATEYEQLGQLQLAVEFRAQNYSRAAMYFADGTRESLIADESPGSLQLRGGAWLLMKYVTDRFGTVVLERMTNSTTSGISNVTAATSVAWKDLLADWGIALWADNAPELAGIPVDARYQFSSINLRESILSSGRFPLSPTRVGFDDFALTGQLGASSQRHILMSATAQRSVFLNFAGLQGGAFTSSAEPQIAVMRY